MTVFTLAALVAGGTAFACGVLVLWHVACRARRVMAHCRRRAMELHTGALRPGPRRDAAVLRQRLAEELRSTRQTLTTSDGRIFQADAASVLVEISTAATALDCALASIERFSDPAQQRVALATVTPQVVQLINTSYVARQTMLRTTAADRDRQLNALSECVAHEAAALAAYEHASPDLTI